ncbi:ROK family protein [Nonomuraea soli]|uniref:Glucokinase n=1 Tax=Nonomuraea soli TaxID=1032476 RepID=A0A7W0HR14_9ACTN|nr:ROK family protein [Nonomuraea soli]MBA2892387.1 glucokinase [Nonomuraea soli]
MPTTPHVLAIDIGGTKLAGALVDADGEILASAQRPTPPADVFGALASLIAELTGSGPPPVAVGIGCAGPLDLAAGTVSPVNIGTWRGFPVRDEVAALTGLPTTLAGDAQCFALGEHWLGAGQGSEALLGVVVSTGIGGGLVMGGVPLLGPTGNAGHVGHMTVEVAGEPCDCGGRGCVERYASGPHLTRWAVEQGWHPDARAWQAGSADGRAGSGDGRAGALGTRAVDARSLAEDAAAGHPVAVAAFERGARALAAMVVSTTAVVDVRKVVIGGGVANAGEVLFAPLRRAVDDLGGLAFVKSVEITRSTLGVRAGLAGAARLAWSATAAQPTAKGAQATATAAQPAVTGARPTAPRDAR